MAVWNFKISSSFFKVICTRHRILTWELYSSNVLKIPSFISHPPSPGFHCFWENQLTTQWLLFFSFFLSLLAISIIYFCFTFQCFQYDQPLAPVSLPPSYFLEDAWNSGLIHCISSRKLLSFDLFKSCFFSILPFLSWTQITCILTLLLKSSILLLYFLYFLYFYLFVIYFEYFILIYHAVGWFSFCVCLIYC